MESAGYEKTSSKGKIDFAYQTFSVLPASFFHMIFGFGTPDTLHGKETSCPSITSWFEGLDIQNQNKFTARNACLLYLSKTLWPMRLSHCSVVRAIRSDVRAIRSIIRAIRSPRIVANLERFAHPKIRSVEWICVTISPLFLCYTASICSPRTAGAFAPSLVVPYIQYHPIIPIYLHIWA